MRLASVTVTSCLSIVNFLFMILPTAAPKGVVFALVLVHFMLFESAILTTYGFLSEFLDENRTGGVAYFFALMSIGKVIGDWVAAYPTMTQVFLGSTVMYAFAAFALAASPGKPRKRRVVATATPA